MTMSKTISGLGRGFALALGAAALAGAILAGPAQAQEPQKLIMMASNVAKSIGSVDFYVAEEAGFLKDEGLEVEVRYASNASQAAQLLAAGSADVGRFSFDPVLIGYTQGIKLTGFYQFYRSLIFYLGIPEDSPIKTLEDLRGKKVGVSNMGSASVGVLKSMLANANIPESDITFVPVGKALTALAARRNGDIDAYMLWNEVYSSLLAAGEKLRFIHHPVLGPLGGNAYFTQPEAIKSKGDALGRFARAIAKAQVYILANPDAAAKIYLKVDPDAGSPDNADDVAKIAGQITFWSTDWKIADGQKYGEINVANLTKYAESMVAAGDLSAVPPMDEVVDNDFIAAANDFDAATVRKLAESVQ